MSWIKLLRELAGLTAGVCLLGQGADARAAQSVEREEVLRIAPLPSCPGGLTLTSSPPEELARAPKTRNKYGREYSPFQPRLVAHAGGVRLVWTPQLSAPVASRQGFPVLTRVWKEGVWSEATVIAEGGDLARFQADALALAPGRWHAAWLETDPNGHGSAARLVGSACAVEGCSPPRQLTGAEDRWSPLGSGFLMDRDGVGSVFWMDEREYHFTPGLYHPINHFLKVYRKRLGAPIDEPDEQVTAKGRYFVTQMTPVRGRQPGDLELVFFKKTDPDSDDIARGSADLYLTTRLEARWSTPKPLLVAAKGYYKPEEVDGFLAFRSPAEELLVVYLGWDVLRVLRRDRRHGSEVTTLAQSVVRNNSKWPSVGADVSPDGTLSSVYHARVDRLVKDNRGWERWTSHGSERQPYYLVRTDGRRCLAAASVAGASTQDSLFDVAVDDAGRTHVVWVESEGEMGVMKHRWFR